MWTRDNLDVLRGLNSERIDLIYADPPFNSNKNYEAPIGSKAAGAAFKDTWTLSDIDVALARRDRRPRTKGVRGDQEHRGCAWKGNAELPDHDGHTASRAAARAQTDGIAVPALRRHGRRVPALAV